MRKFFLVFAVATAVVWSGTASAIVDESQVNTSDQGEELKRSTVSLTPTEEKTPVEHRKPEKEHRAKKHPSSKRTTRTEHRESEAQRRQQIERTIDMINIGVGVGTSLRHGGGGDGGGGGDSGHHGGHHKD